MKYLLDSEIISDFYNESAENYKTINSKVAALGDEDEVFVSVLTFYELEYGHAKAPETMKASLRERIERAKSFFSILPVSLESANTFGKLKKDLQAGQNLGKKSLKKHNIDLMLASTSITKSCILVSADQLYPTLRKFNPKLKIENWLKPVVSHDGGNHYD